MLSVDYLSRAVWSANVACTGATFRLDLVAEPGGWRTVPRSLYPQPPHTSIARGKQRKGTPDLRLHGALSRWQAARVSALSTGPHVPGRGITHLAHLQCYLLFYEFSGLITRHHEVYMYSELENVAGGSMQTRFAA